MKVRLANPFFIEGVRYDRGINELPDEYKDRLPSSAEIVSEEVAKKAAIRKKAKAASKNVEVPLSKAANAKPKSFKQAMAEVKDD